MNKVMQVITEDLIFQLEESETLLEGLERTGHQVEYQCRSGYCGSCRVTLRAGSVDYEKPPLAYLRNWRLFLARQDIDGRARIQSVARGYGYGSPEALSRAITQPYGTSPLQ